MNLKTIIISVVLAVALSVGAVMVLAPKSENGMPNLGALSGPDVYSYLFVHGAFSQGGGVSTATPDDATYTFSGGDMSTNNVLTFVASTTMPALTATLPASTTFPLSSEAGAYRSWVIVNPFLAAATTTTIAAGTGIDLQEPDGQNVVIGINNFAWLTCFRMASTDIVCSVDETIPAD